MCDRKWHYTEADVTENEEMCCRRSGTLNRIKCQPYLIFLTPTFYFITGNININCPVDCTPEHRLTVGERKYSYYSYLPTLAFSFFFYTMKSLNLSNEMPI